MYWCSEYDNSMLVHMTINAGTFLRVVQQDKLMYISLQHFACCIHILANEAAYMYHELYFIHYSSLTHTSLFCNTSHVSQHKAVTIGDHVEV